MKESNTPKEKRMGQTTVDENTQTDYKHPIVEWLTDTMFVIHSDTNVDMSEFSSITFDELCKKWEI